MDSQQPIQAAPAPQAQVAPPQATSAPPPSAGAPAPAAPAKDDRDHLDKGLESAQQKYGGKYLKDPKKNRAINEKITDFLRKFFEKKSGMKVPKSVSN